MAKKNLRAQMDAARAAEAFIGSARSEEEDVRATTRRPVQTPADEELIGGTPAYEPAETKAAPDFLRGDDDLLEGDFKNQNAPDPVIEDTAVKAEPANRRKSGTSAGGVKSARPKRNRKKANAPAEDVNGDRKTAQVLVPMTPEQREHADLLAQVMKITRAEVMRQALDEYWTNHKQELQAAALAYEALIRKLMD